MHGTRSGPRTLLTGLALVAILGTACNSAATPSPSASQAAAGPSSAPVAAASPTPLLTAAPVDASVPGPNGGQIIRWFVGLGAGGQPQQITAQTDFVTKFNNDPANKDKAYISLEIYDNKVATNILKTQIAAGNAPDIIGPVGVEGLNLFIDQLADLQPLIDSTGYDMSRYPAAMKDFFNDRQGRCDDRRAVRHLPVVPLVQHQGVRRGRAPVPADQGRRPVRRQALGHGRGPRAWHEAHRRQERQRRHQPRLRPPERRPVGLRHAVRRQEPPAESDALRARIARSPTTARRPDPGHHAHRREMVQRWRLEGPFHPDRPPILSDLLGKDSEFASGNLAMNEVHTWFACCVNPAAPAKPIVGDNFGWAVAPSFNGNTTAKLHADTFSMLKTTKHPDEAFRVLTALAASGDLSTIYGAMPADPTQQKSFIDSITSDVPEG